VTEPATGAMSDIFRKEIGFFGDWPNSPEEMKMAFTALGYIDEQAAVEIERAKTKREKIDLFYKALAVSSRLRSRGVDKREFISRLNYVNKTFSSFKKIDGWKSPRGRIYIKFGMPDNVFVFPITTWRMYNYEVWYYSPRPASGDRERLFVFVEKDGEYKLDYFPKFPEFGRFPKIPLNMEF
jgi:GWxTD domain-containing protein